MLKAVTKLENLPVNVDKPKLTPLSTNIEKTSEILRMEIVNLTAENEQLQKDVNSLQEKVNTYFNVTVITAGFFSGLT